MEDGHKARHFRPVMHMIRGIPGRGEIHSTIIRTAPHTGKGTRDEIVHKGQPLGAQPTGTVRKQQIIINQRRTVGDLNKDIFSESQAIGDFGALRRNIVMEQVLTHPGALSLPIQP